MMTSDCGYKICFSFVFHRSFKHPQSCILEHPSVHHSACAEAQGAHPPYLITRWHCLNADTFTNTYSVRKNILKEN